LWGVMFRRRSDAAPRTTDTLRKRLPVRAARVRTDVLLMLQDAVLVSICFAVVLVVRYDGAIPSPARERYVLFLPFAIVTFVGVQRVLGLYGQMWRFASILEARRLLVAGMATTAILTAIDVLGSRLVPLSVVLLGSVLTTMLTGTARFQSRLFSARRREIEGHGVRVVVVGAGEAGAELTRQMQQSAHSGLVPVAMLDDDPRTHGRVCMGVPVLGPIDLLPEVAETHNVDQAVLAVGNASADLVRRVAGLAEATGVALHVMPDAGELVRSGLRLKDLRELRIEDLLGRQQVDTDFAAVRMLLTGRRVLITGAGGSIGSEIARQVADCHPAELLLLDHDETHLYEAASILRGRHIQVLADIRDRQRIVRLFQRHRPEVVFHAAAHKHVPLLEDHPCEAVRTNVIGTRNVIDASRTCGVETFVMISTDKAVYPRSVMGASKRVAEQIVVASAAEWGGRFCGVRFGNVLGSRGSVIPTFARQIEAGGPVTVTDARMTRYFMSIPEAVQLVLQAAAMAEGGEIFMLEMGEPVRIMDLAKRMIRLSGRRIGSDVEIRVTGTRPGEKLSEQLRAVDEDAMPTGHSSILRLYPRPIASDVVHRAVTTFEGLSVEDDDQRARDQLMAMANRPERFATDMSTTKPPAVSISRRGSDLWSPSTT
jgi:FlaA1/EpsC-like NDP-sugar epimerase